VQNIDTYDIEEQDKNLIWRTSSPIKLKQSMRKSSIIVDSEIINQMPVVVVPKIHQVLTDSDMSYLKDRTMRQSLRLSFQSSPYNLDITPGKPKKSFNF
jgi:hypothetical protein